MEFFRRPAVSPARLGILPGTFNPLTIAHLALADAARRHCDEVLFVLPRVFPHKEYAGASFEQRLELLTAAVGGDAAFSVAASDRGLFLEIARECRETYGPQVRLTFLCGRDAAERIAGWDYGQAGAFAEMLREFDLLVAARQGEYNAPPDIAGSIACLDVPRRLDDISATVVRERILRGEPWEHLVPAAIRDRVREIYMQPASTGLD